MPRSTVATGLPMHRHPRGDRRAARRRPPLTRIALLGTRFTMTEPFAREPYEERGIIVHELDPGLARRGRPDHLRGARRRPRRPRQPAQAQDPDHRAGQAEGPGDRPRLHRAGARRRRPRQRPAGLRHHRDPRPRRGRVDAWRRKSRRGRRPDSAPRKAGGRSPKSVWMDRTPADRPDHPRAAERFNEEQATYAVRGAERPTSRRASRRSARC